MPADTQDVTLAVINQKLIYVVERVDVAVDILQRQDDRVRALETDLAIIKSESHGPRIRALEESAYPVIRIAKWAAAIIGGLILALLWAIFTGALQLSK